MSAKEYTEDKKMLVKIERVTRVLAIITVFTAMIVFAGRMTATHSAGIQSATQYTYQH